MYHNDSRGRRKKLDRRISRKGTGGLWEQKQVLEEGQTEDIKKRAEKN